jgi:hypothetical protein
MHGYIVISEGFLEIVSRLLEFCVTPIGTHSSSIALDNT